MRRFCPCRRQGELCWDCAEELDDYIADIAIRVAHDEERNARPSPKAPVLEAEPDGYTTLQRRRDSEAMGEMTWSAG